MPKSPDNGSMPMNEVRTLLEDMRAEWRPVIEGWPGLVAKVDHIAYTVSNHEDRLIQVEAGQRMLHRDVGEVKRDVASLRKDNTTFLARLTTVEERRT